MGDFFALSPRGASGSLGTPAPLRQPSPLLHIPKGLTGVRPWPSMPPRYLYQPPGGESKGEPYARKAGVAADDGRGNRGHAAVGGARRGTTIQGRSARV